LNIILAAVLFIGSVGVAISQTKVLKGEIINPEYQSQTDE
jgi:hypothetical protein